MVTLNIKYMQKRSENTQKMSTLTKENNILCVIWTTLSLCINFVQYYLSLFKVLTCGLFFLFTPISLFNISTIL